MSNSIVSTAPARICMFGDHQDYLGLPVIACAIDRHLEVRASPIAEKVFRIRKLDLDSVDLIHLTATNGTAPLGDYLRLSLQVLRRYGCIPDRGYEIAITSTIPINAGLSSSSALTIAWVQFLISVFGIDRPVTPDLVIQLAHEIEVLEQGTAGGKMDHYSIVLGNLIYLETSEEEVTTFDLSTAGMVVGVSGDPKHTSNMLSTRKNGALMAIEQVRNQIPEFQIALAESAEMDRYLPHVEHRLRPYFEAAVFNHAITKQAVASLQTGKFDLPLLGSLMNQHHQLLRDNLKITTPKIDAMIDAALTAGAQGAKIVGSGGGGCIVALTTIENQSAVAETIRQTEALDAFVVEASSGAELKTLTE